MLENNTFNREWNKIHQSLWNVVGSSTAENIGSESNDGDTNTKQSSQAKHYDRWLTEADNFWGDHAKVDPGDIDSLYKKVSSCSHFFFNFSEALTPSNEGETAEDLITKYFEAFSANKICNNDGGTEASAKENKEVDIDLASFLKMPLENLQQQSSLFTTLNSFQSVAPASMGEFIDDPDFKNAFEAYLISLQQYQIVFIQLFMTSAKQAAELIEFNGEKTRSAKQLMSLWFDLLEDNYGILISGSDYSKLYAAVVNSWVVMLSQSGKSFSELMTAAPNSSWAQPHV